MHTDARELADNSLIEGDVCIVGAGAAGIAMALEWVQTSNTRVILLEGGGFNLEAGMQDLYRGDITGKPYYPLQAARLHYFGGTTGPASVRHSTRSISRNVLGSRTAAGR